MGLALVIKSIGKKLLILFFLWFLALIIAYFLNTTIFIILLVIAGVVILGIIALAVLGVYFAPVLLEVLGVDATTVGVIKQAHAAATAAGGAQQGGTAQSAAGHATAGATPTVGTSLAVKIILGVILAAVGIGTTMTVGTNALGLTPFIILAVLILALIVLSIMKKRGSQASPAGQTAQGTSPTTPTDWGQFIKQALIALLIAGGTYFFIVRAGLSPVLTIIISIAIAGFIIGMFRGNAACTLLIWVTAFLFAEAVVFTFLFRSPYLLMLSFMLIIFFSFIIPRIGQRHTYLPGLLVLLTTSIIFFLAVGTDTFRPYMTSGGSLQQAVDTFSEAFMRSTNSIRTNLPGIFTSGRQEAQRRIDILSGNYEEGVEAQSTKQLGVFLENLGLTESRVRKDGVVDLFARLRAESFTTTQAAEPLLITITCKDEKSGKTGSIRPQSTFTIEEYEVFDIDCLFDAKELAEGSNNLILEATFDFATSSFLKSYFMDQETIRTYRRQQQDPLDAFQITDKKPLAVYTPGPMRIGMNAGQQPIGLTTDRDDGPTLTLTLERDWLDGELIELNELAITVPPGLAIDRVSGQDPTTHCTSTTAQEQICVFGKEFISTIITDLTKPFTTIRITTKKRDPTKLLGSAPLSIRSFKTDIRYKYRIKKTYSVFITGAT